MDVLITAGGTPLPGELLYEYTRGAPKAMLNIAGKPMVQWVLDAVSHSKNVEHIVIIGLREMGGITCPKPLTLLPNQSDMLENIRTGMQQVKRLNPKAEQVLLLASDIPAITTEMVDWLIDIVEKSDADLFYNVVSKEIMEKKYPASKRTYTHLKDADICGGDMNAVRIDMLDNKSRLWEDLIASRKNPVKQAYIIGFDLLFKLLFRTATLDEAAKTISHRLGLKGKVIRCPFPQVGMDVDKPHQLEIIRQDLSGAGRS
jgi:GTP:adenosylcobinamide-phosphate guanylyltransferase